MNVFGLRKKLIDDYADYVRSFIEIRDDRIRTRVDEELAGGLLWPEPQIALNPAFAEGAWVTSLVEEGVLHQECAKVFRKKPTPDDAGEPLKLHKHQVDAIRAARDGRNYVLTTGTGSGKSLAYIVPIVDGVLRAPKAKSIKAIVVYPMNALANSQAQELEKFLGHGYPDGKGPVTFRRYTGQEKDEERAEILADPPDILLTNYVMLELILTRTEERKLVQAGKGLRFLVLDELHTYRGRQGADVALLVRRTREAFEAHQLQHVGTSATMATEGTFEDQQREVARVATLVFGATVAPRDVIGETLRRATPTPDLDSKEYVDSLHRRVFDASVEPPADYKAYIADPLSQWIESRFGLTTEAGSDRPTRAEPRPIGGPQGAARELAELTDVDETICADQIQRHLLAGYRVKDPDTGFPVFAFRLHQFITRGDTAYATLEIEGDRFLSLQPQRYVPGDRKRLLFPLTFCRECGQEYYSVRLVEDTTGVRVEARPPEDRQAEGDAQNGYLYLSTTNPWAEEVERLPEDWLEDSDTGRVKRSFRDKLPRPLSLNAKGEVVAADAATLLHFVGAPFRLCLQCGISYGGHQRSDFSKLATLGSEGRSTATTILGLSAVRHLRAAEELSAEARKLLSFTDNRQDASLQAGHFNDFVEVGLLRSALHRAAKEAGESGLEHDTLTQKVFEALALPRDLYALDPTVRFGGEEIDKALRDVLGYRLYLDLRRGWRITSPNLEQTDLLHIDYRPLDEVCAAEDLWAQHHSLLSGASPETRERICRVLLDHMRRELAINVDYLDQRFQERLVQASKQQLCAPWAIDEQEEDRLVHASVLVPRSRRPDDHGGWTYLSPRGGFGMYLRRPGTLPNREERLNLEETQKVILDLLEALRVGGIVRRVQDPEGADDVPGYQISAARLRWRAGKGESVSHDPIRVPRSPEGGARPNQFFLSYYRTIAVDGQGLEAREHTAQVPYPQREERERRFRAGELPILFCSPTMELGVDIASLNVVNMRNVPPTPANYAQRSGRAGRSGQPALVFTYCSGGSPHDQYFFRRPSRMVAGQVTPPRLDLANEDLIRAHVHSIWLAQSGMSLGRSLTDILDVAGDRPSLKLLDSKRADVDAPEPRQRAEEVARRVLAGLDEEMALARWWSDSWLGDVFRTVGRSFEDACERWRSLYESALAQADTQDRIIRDAARSYADKQQAKRLRREAEAQLELLTATGAALAQSDFYSYRYFASEGFLPGYSFPRLPLSAFIPGRKGVKGTSQHEFLSRPRFLAISEFGPRNFIYHEGSRYVINRVILPVSDPTDAVSEGGLATATAKVCSACGYLHAVRATHNPDLCERCGVELGTPLRQLFRLRNVSTARRDRINSDEEERQRMGYELRSTIRFAEAGGETVCQTATVAKADLELATLSYGHAATIWRINMGWRRRGKDTPLGFVLDAERGLWTKDPNAPPDDPDEPLSSRRQRVIPYVEDRRNCLLIEPGFNIDEKVLVSLQAALKNAIQVEYQLEDTELAAEPLPDRTDRRLLLFYEAAEGGAGVLRRLVEEPKALSRVARKALEICHFDPDTGEDLGRAPGARDRCEAACYDCLMSYTNQPDHPLLDRTLLMDTLAELMAAEVAISPTAVSREEQFDRLSRQAESELERRWLRHVLEGGYRLPDAAGRLFPEAGTRPDFVYTSDKLAVYIDGPAHDHPDRAERDRENQTALEDLGYLVARFRHDDEWAAIIDQHPSIFGEGS